MTELHLHWLDVASCVQLTATNRPSPTLAGGWFRVEANALPAFVTLPTLVHLGGHIGDDFDVAGTVTTGYLATPQARDVFVRQQTAVLFALVSLANTWSLQHLQTSKQAAFNDLTRRFITGTMTGDDWLANQQTLLFGDRPPTLALTRLQARLQAKLATLDAALATIATPALIVTALERVRRYQSSQMP